MSIMPDKNKPEVGDTFYEASVWAFMGFLAGRRDTCFDRVTVTWCRDEEGNRAYDDEGNMLVRHRMEGSDRNDNMGSTCDYHATEKEALEAQKERLREFEEENDKDYRETCGQIRDAFRKMKGAEGAISLETTSPR